MVNGRAWVQIGVCVTLSPAPETLKTKFVGENSVFGDSYPFPFHSFLVLLPLPKYSLYPRAPEP